jgi:hypothetical protein
MNIGQQLQYCLELVAKEAAKPARSKEQGAFVTAFGEVTIGGKVFQVQVSLVQDKDLFIGEEDVAIFEASVIRKTRDN